MNLSSELITEAFPKCQGANHRQNQGLGATANAFSDPAEKIVFLLSTSLCTYPSPKRYRNKT